MTVYVTGRFRRAVDHLLSLEGGYVNHGADKGGETNFGISKRSYPTVDIRRLTRDDAMQIYHRDYWSPLRLDELLSEPVARCVFDFGVNAGIGTAAKALQRAINGCGRALKVDGTIGPATIAAANRIGGDMLLPVLCGEIMAHYEAIVRRDPTQAVFLRGWRNRLQAQAGVPA